jgi:hypothetical protein
VGRLVRGGLDLSLNVRVRVNKAWRHDQAMGVNSHLRGCARQRANSFDAAIPNAQVGPIRCLPGTIHDQTV